MNAINPSLASLIEWLTRKNEGKPYFDHNPEITADQKKACFKWLSHHREKKMPFYKLHEFFLQQDPINLAASLRPKVNVSHAEADEYNLDYFYTGIKCKNGHRTAQLRKGGHCLTCHILNQIFSEWKEFITGNQHEALSHHKK